MGNFLSDPLRLLSRKSKIHAKSNIDLDTCIYHTENTWSIKKQKREQSPFLEEKGQSLFNSKKIERDRPQKKGPAVCAQ
jgi:hypothetical protein